VLPEMVAVITVPVDHPPTELRPVSVSAAALVGASLVLNRRDA
jgi:hypothetical protein